METRDATTHWTRADLDRFPDDGHRRELLPGFATAVDDLLGDG